MSIELITLKPDEMLGQKPPFVPVGGTWIAGGAIRQWFSRTEESSDIDIFAINEKSLLDFKNEYLLSPYYKMTNKTKYQETWSNHELSLQLINIKYYANAHELLDSFDFTICQFAWDGKTIYSTKEAVISTLRKHLAVHRIAPEFAVDSLRRAFKYNQKGYKPCWGSLRDLANSLRVLTPEQIQQAVEISPAGGRRLERYD